jgi:hypothetical protein
MSLMHFVVSPPGCGRSVIDFWVGRPWGAVTLSHWGGWWYMNMRYQEGPQTQVLLNYPGHGHHGNLLLQGKIPMVELGIEPGISSQKLRPLDYEDGYIYIYIHIFLYGFIYIIICSIIESYFAMNSHVIDPLLVTKQEVTCTSLVANLCDSNREGGSSLHNLGQYISFSWYLVRNCHRMN